MIEFLARVLGSRTRVRRVAIFSYGLLGLFELSRIFYQYHVFSFILSLVVGIGSNVGAFYLIYKLIFYVRNRKSHT